MLLSEVMADNVPSLKALMRAGYRECGRLPRRWWKRGAYRDRVLLYVERDEWLRNAPPLGG
jgi:RimJ/RimL family protein N-acetyltransferase